MINFKPCAITKSQAHDVTEAVDIKKYLRFKNWSEPAKDTLVWFLFGLLITYMISMFSPGRPILVGTESIPKGVYWLSHQVGQVKYGDTLTFDFRPKDDWVIERYANNGNRVFTKYVKGLPGDVVSQMGGVYQLCRSLDRRGVTDENRCEFIGKIRDVDSLGRPMHSWLKEGSYVIQEGELWIFSPHERSLDSRYYGPISVKDVKGRATPLLTW